MASIEVFLAVACKNLLDLLNGRYMMSEGKELATLIGVVALASGLECAMASAAASR